MPQSQAIDKSQNTVLQAVQADGDKLQLDEAELKDGDRRDDQKHPAKGPPARVVIRGETHRKYPFTIIETLNLLVQLLNIIGVFVFGVWAIRSYNAAVIANELSKNATEATLQALSVAQAANALTMFQICQSNINEVS